MMNSVGLFRRLLLGTRSRLTCLNHAKKAISPEKMYPLCTCSPSDHSVRQYSQLTSLRRLVMGITMKVLQFANSFRERKNEKLIRRINRDIDGNFSLEKFATDVKFAFSKLSQLLATRQYRKMRELTYNNNDRPITFLQEYIESLLDQGLVQHLYFKPEEFSVLDPNIVETVTQNGVHAVVVDVAAVAVKFIGENKPLMMHLHVRFGQAYSEGAASGWLVVDIPFVHIRKLSRVK